MQKTKMKIRTRNLFTIASMLMSIKLILQSANHLVRNIGFLDSALIGLSLVCFITDFILHAKYKVKEILFILVLGVLCLYTCVTIKDYNLLITYFWMITSINYSFEYGLYVIYKTKLYTMLICAIASVIVTVLTGNNALTMRDGDSYLFIFGFAHPNTLALLIFWTTLEYAYLSYRLGKRKNVVFRVVLLNTLYFLLGGSKTPLIGVIIWALGMILVNTNKIKPKTLKHISMGIFPVSGLLFFYLVDTYAKRGGPLYQLAVTLDEFITGRIRIAAWLYEVHGITILGQEIKRRAIQWDSYYNLTTVTIDGMFVSLLLQVGLIYYVLFSIGAIKTAKNGDSLMQLSIIAYTYYAISEINVLNGFIAYPLLMMGYYFLKKDEAHQFAIQEQAEREVIKDGEG